MKSFSLLINCCQRIHLIKVETKKCQIVTKVNHAKRFIYSGMRKLFNENYDDMIDADETTAELL